MNKQSIRSFGIATFLIGAIIYSMNMLSIPLPGVASADDEATKKITALEQELADTKEQLAQKATTQQKPQADAAPQPPAETTITIYRGVTGYDISRKLEDAGIIENALEFELFLVNNGYSKRLQIGDFTVDASMSEEEIAELLTTLQ